MEGNDRALAKRRVGDTLGVDPMRTPAHHVAILPSSMNSRDRQTLPSSDSSSLERSRELHTWVGRGEGRRSYRGVLVPARRTAPAWKSGVYTLGGLALATSCEAPIIRVPLCMWTLAGVQRLGAVQCGAAGPATAATEVATAQQLAALGGSGGGAGSCIYATPGPHAHALVSARPIKYVGCCGQV